MLFPRRADPHDVLQDRFARTSIIGLGKSLVSSRIRVPRPAARAGRALSNRASLMTRGVSLVFGRAIVCVPALKLNRGVLDPEALVQLVSDGFEQVDRPVPVRVSRRGRCRPSRSCSSPETWR